MSLSPSISVGEGGSYCRGSFSGYWHPSNSGKQTKVIIIMHVMLNEGIYRKSLICIIISLFGSDTSNVAMSL